MGACAQSGLYPHVWAKGKSVEQKRVLRRRRNVASKSAMTRSGPCRCPVGLSFHTVNFIGYTDKYSIIWFLATQRARARRSCPRACCTREECPACARAGSRLSFPSQILIDGFDATREIAKSHNRTANGKRRTLHRHSAVSRCLSLLRYTIFAPPRPIFST